MANLAPLYHIVFEGRGILPELGFVPRDGWLFRRFGIQLADHSRRIQFEPGRQRPGGIVAGLEMGRFGRRGRFGRDEHTVPRTANL